MVTETMRTQVLELYTAYFNRAADRAGVDYWLNEMDANGWDVLTVASSFTDSPEYTNLYGSKSNAQIVESVYQNVLGRSGDDAGVAYWLGELDGGTIAVQNFITAVVNAATEEVNGIAQWPQDKAMVDNKSAVSQYCYDLNINDTDISLASVTSDSSSVESVTNEIAQSLYQIVQLTSTYYMPIQQPQIAALGDGGFVVTFEAGGGIAVQKFNANGTVASSMVQVESLNNVTNHNEPKITALRDGGFAVTYWGDDSDDDWSVFVQTFDANGAVIGSKVQLEAPGNTTGYDSHSVIAALEDGGFAVAFGGQENENEDKSIFVQRFDSNGNVVGSMVQLEGPSRTDASEWYSQITALADGGFAVTFCGEDSGGDDSIFVQRFDINGALVGSMTELKAPLGPDVLYYPKITALQDSGFVVTFEGKDSNGNNSVFIQTFDANGVTLGSIVQANSLGAVYYDSDPDITGLQDGGFALTFKGKNNNDYFEGHSLFVQKFNADGTTTNNAMVQLEAPGYIYTSIHDPEITALTDGGFAVTFIKHVDGAFTTFVQKFNADGTIAGSMTQFGTLANSFNNLDPNITGLVDGGFVVSFYGDDIDVGDPSIYVQKFNADGTFTIPADTNTVELVGVTTDDTVLF